MSLNWCKNLMSYFKYFAASDMQNETKTGGLHSQQWHIKFTSQLLVKSQSVTMYNGWTPLAVCTFVAPRPRQPIKECYDVNWPGCVNIF